MGKLVFGCGESTIQAVREGDNDPENWTIARVLMHDRVHESIEVSKAPGERWCVLVEDVAEADLDADPAVIAYCTIHDFDAALRACTVATARDPRLASHSLRDDERPSPRRPITMPRELWARIDLAVGGGRISPWLREAALAKLDGAPFDQLEHVTRLLVERLTTGDLTPAKRLASVRRELPAIIDLLAELDRVRGYLPRDPTLGQGIDR